ncbi:hypothetical protein DCO48_09715 [Pseudomonas sp. SDI]|uniref:hypothetical protein n=1 Tax=Pseudomonas sp. SDI TaxID=2170734 RepID=UPI000DE713E0|nr:hypothetical protein [Pseudomonas sp. SDI]PWB33567.1 hypothetical protein DCO48_09715 [Pseudomonas sp. SDI]
MNASSHLLAARDCAGLFRLGRDVEGALRMVELLDGLLALFEQAPEPLRAQSAQVLGALLAAQQGQDWIALADYLEYELVHLIDQAASA